MQAMGYHYHDLRLLRGGNLMRLARAAWKLPSHWRLR
jgi:hypothetical protein